MSITPDFNIVPCQKKIVQSKIKISKVHRFSRNNTSKEADPKANWISLFKVSLVLRVQLLKSIK
jgi:hypothetical protein